MAPRRHAPGDVPHSLFDLPIAYASRWIFNCYVVHDSGIGRPLVIDAGMPCTAAGAVDALRELGKPKAQLASTHGHSDHVSGIPSLLGRWADEVHLPARCEAYLEGEAARSPGPRQVAKLAPMLADPPFDATAAWEFASGADIGYGKTSTMRVPFPVTGYLRDGDRLGDWRVIAAAGHSDDSTCLYHEASATLISGDAVISVNGRAWFNPEVVDPRDARQTQERLRGLEVRHLLPGHGLPIVGRHLLRDALAFDAPPRGRSILARLARTLGAW